jgi:hypothetical protein
MTMHIAAAFRARAAVAALVTPGAMQSPCYTLAPPLRPCWLSISRGGLFARACGLPCLFRSWENGHAGGVCESEFSRAEP